MANITFTKDGTAIFMTTDGKKMGIPKGVWVFAHPSQTGMVVISNKPFFDGQSGIVVPQADVTAPASTGVDDLITKLHRDFFS